MKALKHLLGRFTPKYVTDFKATPDGWITVKDLNASIENINIPPIPWSNLAKSGIVEGVKVTVSSNGTGGTSFWYINPKTCEDVVKILVRFFNSKKPRVSVHDEVNSLKLDPRSTMLLQEAYTRLDDISSSIDKLENAVWNLVLSVGILTRAIKPDAFVLGNENELAAQKQKLGSTLSTNQFPETATSSNS